MDVTSRFLHQTGSVDLLAEPYNVRQRYTAYLPDANDATSLTPVPRVPPKPSPIRRHSETPAESARRRQARRAVVSNPIIGLDFDENNNIFSEAAEDLYTTDFIGSGLKKLRSNSWESLVRWEKENEILHAFIEDECEWLAELFPEEHGINPKHFFQTLQDGVVLVKLAELCQNYAESYGLRNNLKFPFFTVTCHPHEKCSGPMGRFLSRENVDLFIRWCRAHKINECILFESNDVVEQDDNDGLREGAREIVLCLMEFARYGVKFGMKAPKLIMLEKEIEYEEELEHIDGSTSPRSCDSGVDIESDHFNLSYLGNDQYQVELRDSEIHDCEAFNDADFVQNNSIPTKLMDPTDDVHGHQGHYDVDLNNSQSCEDHSTIDPATREILNNKRNADLNNNIISTDSSGDTALSNGKYNNGHCNNEKEAVGQPSRGKKSKAQEPVESEATNQRTPRRSSSNVSNLSKSDLHNIVTKIVEEYNIEKITRLKEGKYIILGKIMFVRLLNQHCIVRIGGGWDTLEHYILTHVNKSSVVEIDLKTPNESTKKKKQSTHGSNPDLSSDPPSTPKTPTGSSRPLPFVSQEKAKRQRDDKVIMDAISRVQADFMASHSPGSPTRPATAMDRRKNSSEANDEMRPVSALAKIPSEESVDRISDDEMEPASNGVPSAKSEYELSTETNGLDCTDRGILPSGEDGCHGDVIVVGGQVKKNVVTTTITEVIKVTTDETGSSGGGKVVSAEVLATDKSVKVETKAKKNDIERESGKTAPKVGSKTAAKPSKTTSKPLIKQALLPSKPKTTKTVSKTVEGGKTTIKTQIITKLTVELLDNRNATATKASKTTSKPHTISRPAPVRSFSFNKQTTRKPTPSSSNLARTSSNPSLTNKRSTSPAPRPTSLAIRPTSPATGPVPTKSKPKAARPVSAYAKLSSQTSKPDVEKAPLIGRQPRTASLSAKPTRTSSLRLAKSAEASGRPASAPPTPPTTTKKTTSTKKQPVTNTIGTKSPSSSTNSPCTSKKPLVPSTRDRSGSLKHQSNVSKSSTDLGSRHNSIDTSTLTRKKTIRKNEEKCLRTSESTPSLTSPTSQKSLTRKATEKLTMQTASPSLNAKRETTCKTSSVTSTCRSPKSPSTATTTTCKPFLTGGSSSRHSSMRKDVKPLHCTRSNSLRKPPVTTTGRNLKTTGTSSLPPACKSTGKSNITGGSGGSTSRTTAKFSLTLNTIGAKRTDLGISDKDSIELTETGSVNNVIAVSNENVDCVADSGVLCQPSSSVVEDPVASRTDTYRKEKENALSTTTTITTTTTTTTLPSDLSTEEQCHETSPEQEIGSSLCGEDLSKSVNSMKEDFSVDRGAITCSEVASEQKCGENDTSLHRDAFSEHTCHENDVVNQQNIVEVSPVENSGATDACAVDPLSDDVTIYCKLSSHSSSDVLCGIQTSEVEEVELKDGSESREHVREGREGGTPPRTAWDVNVSS